MGGANSSICDLLCEANDQASEDIIVLNQVLSNKEFFPDKMRWKNKVSNISTASTGSCRELFILDESSSFRDSNPSRPEELCYVQTANHLYQKGELQGSINNYMIALHKVQRRDVRMADIHFTIAQCYFAMGNFNTALKHCKLAEAKYAQLTGKTSEGVAMACNLIGHIQTQINDYILAQHYYEKAYQIYREEEDSNYKNLIQVGFNLASLYLSMDKDDKALEIYEQMQDLVDRDSKIAKDSTILELQRCIGLNTFKLQLYQRSIKHFKKAFELSLSLSQPKTKQVYTLVNSFNWIKGYILSIPSLKKSSITSSTFKKFAELTRLIQ